MGQVPFDRLHTVRLTHESQTGYTEVCREPDGTLSVRLRIRSAACQREFLSGPRPFGKRRIGTAAALPGGDLPSSMAL